MNNLEVKLNEGTVKTIPSYEVAEMMNKQHWEVLRMLDNLHYSLKDTVKKYGYNCLKKNRF